MKTAFTLLVFSALTATVSAIEFVTLNVASEDLAEFGAPEAVLTVPHTSLVQIEGQSASGLTSLVFSRPDGTKILASRLAGGATSQPTSVFAGGVTGITQIRLQTEGAGARGFVTLKITSADEINTVTPSAVLVLPDDVTGNFDIVIESSEDLVKWNPFFSQTINSQTASRFFRTRITKTP